MDTVRVHLPQENSKDRKATYVRAVRYIRPQKTETHRARFTAGGNLIDYTRDVSTPTSYLNTMKPHVKSNI